MMGGKKRAFGMAALIAGAAIALSGAVALEGMWRDKEAAMPAPSPLAEEQRAEDGYPVVDWAYWQHANPDVIAWMTIPGTGVDLPIVQAPQDDPDFYLSHDVAKNRNANGCPYLDAACAENGFRSRNCVVFGHNMDDGGMFSELAGYSDPFFAAEHPAILLQGPGWRLELAPAMVGVVDASEEEKRVDFADDADFDGWWEEKRAAAVLELESDGAPARAFSFVTCSYNRWGNERTVVYAARKGGMSGAAPGSDGP